MASLKDVYDLIHSLEKREKIQFNMFANATSGKAKDSYINDYQCFINQKTYNKEELKTALNKVKKRAKLSDSNTNLYNCILDSLLGSFKKKVKKVSFLNEIQKLEILFQKGLIDQSSQLFYKLKQSFDDSQSGGLQLSLLEFENELLLQLPKTHNKYDESIQLIDEQLDYVKALETKLEFKKLTKQIFGLASTVGTPRNQEALNKYIELSKSKALKLNIKFLPKSSYANYYLIKAMLLMTTSPNNHKDLYAVLQEGLTLVNKEININEDFIPAFFLLRMAMQAAVAGNDEKEAVNRIRDFKEAIPYFKSNKHQNLSKIVLISSYLIYYLTFNKSTEAFIYLKEKKEEMLDESIKASGPHYYLNYISAARVCILNEDYEQALEFVNLLLDIKGKIRKAVLPAIYCLYLMSHYKMGNNEYLPYAIRNLYKSFLKAGQLYEPEKALLSFFRKSSKLLDIKPEVQKLYDKLLQYKEDPFHLSFFGNADYLIWLKDELN